MTEAIATEEGPKVFVGNLSYSTTEDQLVQLFKSACNVVDAQIVKRNDRSKGFGFVRVKEEADIAKAVEALHHKDVEGRQINVENAKPLVERPDRPAKQPKEPKEPRDPSDKPKSKRRPKKKAAPTSDVNEESAEGTEGTKKPVNRRSARTRPARPRGEPSKTTVFVSNLSFKATEDELASHFAEYKPVRIHIVRNKSGKPQGVAFVEFPIETVRDEAIEKLNKVELGDRVLLLKIATADRPKEEVVEESEQ